MINKRNDALNKITHFARDERGAVAVEFAIVMLFLILIMYLVTDFGITIAKQGKLERTSHSLASLVREREALYASDEELTQEQVDQLLSVAQALLMRTDLTLVVDALYLTADALNPRNNDLARVSKSLSFQAGSRQCRRSLLATDVTALKKLTPYASSSGRWVPIYRVSICIPNEASLFKKISGIFRDDILPDIISSDVVISRN